MTIHEEQNDLQNEFKFTGIGHDPFLQLHDQTAGCCAGKVETLGRLSSWISSGSLKNKKKVCETQYPWDCTCTNSL